MKTTLKRESLLIPKNSKKFTIGGGKYRSVCRTSFAYPPPFYSWPAGAMTSSLLSRRVENKTPFPRNTTFWDPHPKTQLPLWSLNIRTLFPFLSSHKNFFHYGGFLHTLKRKRFFIEYVNAFCGCESATKMRVRRNKNLQFDSDTGSLC